MAKRDREEEEQREQEPSVSAEAAAGAASATLTAEPTAPERSEVEPPASVDASATGGELEAEHETAGEMEREAARELEPTTKRPSEQPLEPQTDKPDVAQEPVVRASDRVTSEVADVAASGTDARATSEVTDGASSESVEASSPPETVAEPRPLNAENPQPTGRPVVSSSDSSDSSKSSDSSEHVAPVANTPATTPGDVLDVDPAELRGATTRIPEQLSEAIDEDDASKSSKLKREQRTKGSRGEREKWYEQDASSAPKAQATIAGTQRNSQSPKIVPGSPTEDHPALADPSQSQDSSASLRLTVETIVAADPFLGGGPGAGSVGPGELLSSSSPSLSTATETSLLSTSGQPSSTDSSRRGSAVPSNPAAGQPGDAADLTQQEKMRLIQRVTRSFARLGSEGGQINLRLHPPQLGSLNVQVRLEGRSMTAKLITETGAARDAILESLPVLRSRLAEQGFEISQFQVDVANNDSADASQGGNAGDQAFDQAANRSSNGARELFSSRRPASAETRTSDAEHPAVGVGNALRWQAKQGIDIQA